MSSNPKSDMEESTSDGKDSTIPQQPSPEVRSKENPTSPASSSEEDEVVDRGGSKSGTPSDQEELLPIPPSIPKAGMSILSHKLWIGNLDKRLTE